MEVSFRILQKDELHLVRQVADVVWPITFREILSPEQIAYMMKMMYAPEVMDKEFDEGIRFCLVEDDANPIGYIVWGQCDEVATAAKLHKCYLLPEYQGKGIGTQMLQQAIAYAKEAGYKSLRLNVNRHNAKAIKAYNRNGFQTIQTVDNPIGNGYFMNDFVMEKILDS